MGRVQIQLENGKIVKCTTDGMKAKPVGKIEKLRRTMTRNRTLDIKGKWERLNAPIVYPKLDG